MTPKPSLLCFLNPTLSKEVINNQEAGRGENLVS